VAQTVVTDDGRFEWDADKNSLNVAKHGIDFDYAKKVYRIEEYDDFHSTYKEDRYRVVGIVDGDILFVVETELESGRIRIISARYAEKIYRDRYFLLKG